MKTGIPTRVQWFNPEVHLAPLLVWVLVMLVSLPPAQATDVVMKDVTLGFGEALKHCREESQLTEDQMEEFFHFWREDFRFEHRELGCAIRCMTRHFDMITDSHRLHHENTEKFIKSFPNGEILARRMVDIIHTCELKFDHEEDHCWRILRIAECFKHTCVEQGLAPTMEMLLAEFIIDVDA